jgi:hypothetical protein
VLMNVFISYSHEEAEFEQQLARRLSALEHCNVTHDASVSPGQNWRTAVTRLIEEADVILLLVSDAFQTSGEVASEVKRAVERQRSGESAVLPIRLRSVSFHGAPYEHIQAVPSKWSVVEAPDREAAWDAVMNAIRAAFQERLQFTNHLLISETSHFSNTLRDCLLGNWRKLGIGRYRYTFKKYKEDKNKAKQTASEGFAAPQGTSTEGNYRERSQSELYVSDYKTGLNRFLAEQQTNNCLFTIYPEEENDILTPKYEREVIEKLIRKKQRILCFESGKRLLGQVRPGEQSPIVVIQSDFALGARTIIRRYLVPVMHRGPHIHFVLLPGPSCDVMEQRWREYRNFLTRLHLAHEGIQDGEYCCSKEGHEWK